MKILLCGVGVVGRHTLKKLVNIKDSQITIYDPPLGYKPCLKQEFDVAIYCMNVRQEADLLNMFEIVRTRSHVVRSTIWPSLLRRMPNISYWPEFLKERSPEGSTSGLCEMMSTGCKLLHHFPNAKAVPILELILAKLYQNSYFAVRVHHSNLFHRWALSLGASYNVMRDAAHLLPRAIGDMSQTGSFVPGPDGLTGFGGKCLPKDTLFVAENVKDAEDSQWLYGMLSKNMVERYRTR